MNSSSPTKTTTTTTTPTNLHTKRKKHRKESAVVGGKVAAVRSLPRSAAPPRSPPGGHKGYPAIAPEVSLQPHSGGPSGLTGLEEVSSR
ncbi:hypothetical protein E2C01_094109 [Portunus trituberculatus]|uniref:Uncharacterized protein n=1 Tax=Portunus trituberculatus TaxID=210409 RepID=A0A5B7K0Q3_PORTR|nr:hypothetical protein [Portunus trituberculatus]